MKFANWFSMAGGFHFFDFAKDWRSPMWLSRSIVWYLRAGSTPLVIEKRSGFPDQKGFRKFEVQKLIQEMYAQGREMKPILIPSSEGLQAPLHDNCLG